MNVWRSWLFGLLLLAGMSGCMQPTPGEVVLPTPPPEVTDEELRDLLDYTLDAIHDQRTLTLREHAAWQILHGALTYQTDFPVENAAGERISAVEHILSGGAMTGWTVEPGTVLDDQTGRRGLRLIMEPGSKTGQGHYDQWLAILAQCNLPLEQTIQVGDETFTLGDVVEQVKLDLPRNTDQEYSWTLIGLTTYMPVNAPPWKAFDGSDWNIERLVRIEGEQVGQGPCGGTHRMIGLAMTLNRHLAQGGELTPLWSDIDAQLQEAILRTKMLQNPDGSLSTNYFIRNGSSPDLAKNLAATGHTLEFLTLAMNDEQINEPWVRNAVLRMCKLFEDTKDIPLECGALYHAAHGLSLYRTRMYGPRNDS